MANQDIKKNQNMQNAKPTDKMGKPSSTKEFTSSDKMRDSDISKQSGQQGVKPEKSNDLSKRK